MLGVPTEAVANPEAPPMVNVEKTSEQAEQNNTPDENQAFKRRDNYTLLAKLLYEGSGRAMREVFDTIHPPISLLSRLTKVQIVKSLRRLQQQGTLTPEQWRFLYPKDKGTPLSTNFDTKLLRVLLQHICHLSPPYPNGWEGIPLSTDTSLSADLVRLDYIRRSVISMKGSTEDDGLEKYSNILTEILTRIGGPIAKIKSDTLAKDPIKEEEWEFYKDHLIQWGRYHERMMRAGADPTSPEPNTNQLVKDFTLPQITTSHVAKDRPDSQQENQESEAGEAERAAAGLLSLPGATPGAGAQRSRSNSRVSSGARVPEMLRQDRAILVEHHKTLVENVRSDVVLPRLVMTGILSHEEKNGINLATRNIDRMKALLRLLPTKPRHSFGAFCEAIKFKHVSIYEQLMKAKKIAMEKPDDISEASMNLTSSYRSKMSKISPIPWHPRANVDICDFYVPLHITDAKGNEFSPSTILQTKVKLPPGRGRRIMIEGESGSGKSTICRYITTEWANGTRKIDEDYKLVYYINVKLLKSSLNETILECCHEDFNKHARDNQQLIETYQAHAMFILDGLEDLSPKVMAEVMDLVYGRIFPKSCVLVTLNSMYVTQELRNNFDTKLVVMGLSQDKHEEFVQSYAQLTHTPDDLYTELVEKVIDKKECDTAVHILAQNPQFCMCMCLLAESGIHVEDINSATDLLEAFLLAIQKTYCSRNGLKIHNEELPEVVQNLTQDIEEMAWRCMHQNGSFFTYEQAEEEDAQVAMYAFGFIEKRSSSTLVTLRQEYFSNRIFQDYMAARVLCRLEEEDFMEHVDDLVNDKYYCNVTKFLCGLLKDDRDTGRLGSIFAGLAKNNLTHWRGYNQPSSPTFGDNQPSIIEIGPMEGRLGDFKLSLECLTECQNRDDMIKIICESLPTRLFTLNKKTLTHGGILGLAKCLILPDCKISELELKLDHFARYHDEALYILGKSINESRYMRELKLNWLDPDLLAELLAHIFYSPCHISAISCTCPMNWSTENRVSAGVWSNMKAAALNMSSVETFKFSNCENKAMVTCVLHCLPHTIQHLAMTDCAMDLVSAQELDQRIGKSDDLLTLDLSGMTIHTLDFNHICAGLKMSESLRELVLANTNLDVLSLDSLAEALTFNRSLQHINLSNNQFPDSACESLGAAFDQNYHLKKLSINGATMTKKGKRLLVNRNEEEVLFAGAATIQYRPASFTLSKESTVILNQLLSRNRLFAKEDD